MFRAQSKPRRLCDKNAEKYNLHKFFSDYIQMRENMSWKGMVWFGVMVLVVLGSLGLLSGFGRGVLNLPLVVAAYSLILSLVTGRRKLT